MVPVIRPRLYRLPPGALAAACFQCGNRAARGLISNAWSPRQGPPSCIMATPYCQGRATSVRSHFKRCVLIGQLVMAAYNPDTGKHFLFLFLGGRRVSSRLSKFTSCPEGGRGKMGRAVSIASHNSPVLPECVSPGIAPSQLQAAARKASAGQSV